MANFSAVSSEVFTILRSFDYVLDLYDEKSNKVYEPADARKFFASKTHRGKTQNLLVMIEDLNESSIIQLNTGPSSDSVALSGLWESLKTCATKYNMTYSLVPHDKEIHPKDFASHSATIHEGKNYMIDLTENMYGTSRSSYLRIGEAKLIVRHSKRIDDTVPGARKRCVEHVFIENAQGERHMMPHNDLAAGRAMGQHVNQGGSWADDAATQINNMAGYFNDLGQSASYLGGAALAEGCSDIREKCKSRRKSIRETFNRIFREDTYAGEIDKLTKAGDPPLLEGSNLDKLREQMTIEGRKLPENVLNACARVLAETDDLDGDVLDEEVQGADEIEQVEDDRPAAGKTISVLGVQVNADAWTAFKEEGKLDLKGTPKFDGQPHFKNVTAQVMFKMHSLRTMLIDETMRELLDKVYNDYVSEKLPKDPKERGLITKLVVLACRAANIPIVTESALGPRGVEAILEMEEWFAGFNPNRVLLEMDCDKEIEDHMNDHHSKKSDAEDHESDHDRIEPECEDEVEDHKEKHHKIDEVAVIDAETPKAEEDDDTPVDDVNEMFSFDQVARLQEMFGKKEKVGDDETVEEGMFDKTFRDIVQEDDDEDLEEDLTQEDILLPKSQGLDLAQEVVAEPEDSEEMSRILSLAGRPQAQPLGEGGGGYRAVPATGSYTGDKYDVVDATGKKVGLGMDRAAAERSAQFKNDGKPSPK